MASLAKKIDWQLAAAATVLILAGLFSLLSSSPDFFYKQIYWIAISLAAAIAITFVDLRSFFSHKTVIRGLFLLIIIVLIFAFFFAPQIKGNRSWIIIGSFQFQPSEFAKVVLIIVLAYFFSKAHIGIGRWKIVMTSFFYFFVLGALVAILPDMGSAFVLFALWFGFVLVSGMPLKKILLSAAIFTAIFAVMWASVLKPYQKERVLGTFFPNRDPMGTSYHVIQSKIAIGSGGIFGQGFRQGSQVQLGFLPEAQTDFIFAAIAEEGGLAAVIIIIGAFGWMILRILKIGSLTDGNFNKFLCLGTAILFLSQFILNVGSNLGLLPVIGVTFPFVSYGGSSMLASMILVGMIQSAWVKRG
jgi:rod shape determining protein RodA